MQRYLLIRFGQSLITLLGVSIIVFTLARLSGNPLDVLVPEESGPEVIEQISKLWGLDKPIHEQYITFVTNAVRGDFGNSIKWQGQKAMDLVLQRFPATLQLASLAVVVAVGLSVPIGVLSAYKKGSWMDYLGKFIALLGQIVLWPVIPPIDVQLPDDHRAWRMVHMEAITQGLLLMGLGLGGRFLLLSAKWHKVFFWSALIKYSGAPVISADPRSAAYSRYREIVRIRMKLTAFAVVMKWDVGKPI